MSARRTVAIGMPCGPTLPWQTANAMTATSVVCHRHNVGFELIMVAGSSLVTVARNAVLTKFLDNSKAERLFWVDSDIEWHPKDFLKLVTLTDEFDIVSGAYPMKIPTTPVVVNSPEGDWHVNDYGLLKIESVGIGFTCMRREPLAKWAEGKPKEIDANATNEPIYRCFSEGQGVGEDIRCFRELGALGYQAWLDPTIELGHIGTYTYKRNVVDALGLTDFYKDK